MLEKLERVARLFDFYGKLLTEKQQAILSLYYDQNLSLGEIAEEYKISRQAVHDLLKRGEKTLAEYEEKLGLVRKYLSEQELLEKILNLLDSLDVSPGNKSLKNKISKMIREIAELQEND